MGWRAIPLSHERETNTKVHMNENKSPIESLERIFHEPKRLAIMSALTASNGPLAFIELKESCDLTDGNLNRHLQVLADEGVIRINKTFVKRKPRTTVAITTKGIKRFSEYLDALRHVLHQAEAALPAKAKKSRLSKQETTTLSPKHALS
jgi:DNA-binding transcriptional ArsR family regulator